LEPLKSNDPRVLGEWRIMGRLGEGGFGTVFLAEKGAQKAAIKVIRDEFVEEEAARNRLAVEAEVLSKISDPSIGKILDSDLSGALPWIATEFINGPTLDNKVKYEGPLEEIAWFNLAANIFHAIVSANALNVIHKDIKPSNIILGETGNKLIDFGIAHVTGQTRTIDFGDREGSTPFSSPEHFTVKTNPKMDVFSAAATLAFAGKSTGIWNGDTDLQLMRSINEDEPNLVGLSENQIKFLTPLLEKNPSDRPSAVDAHQLALGYIEFLLGKAKRPISTHSKRIRKASFKPKYAAGFIALALLVSLFVSRESLIGLVSSKSGIEAKDCLNSLRNGSLDLAIESCSKAVRAGSEASKIYLARAYKAKGSDAESKKVLTECLDANVACKSDYAFFFEDSANALKSLKMVEEKGDTEAAWRIGLSYQKKNEISQALSWYEKSSASGNAVANVLLATYWGGSNKDVTKGISYAKKAIDGDLTGSPNLLVIDHPVERLLNSLYTNANDIEGKVNFFKKCANEKVVICVSILAETFLNQEDYVNAKKWGGIGADLQDARSMWVLAKVAAHKNSLLPKGTVDNQIDTEIVGWYKKSAELGDVDSSFALGFLNAFGVGSLKADFKESCVWYQKTMAAVTNRKGTYKESSTDQDTYKKAAQFFQLQTCQTILLDGAPALTLSSPTPSTSKTPNVTSSPSPKGAPSSSASKEATPLLSSENFKVSAPVGSNVVKDSIFGRAFKDGLHYWHIPLTNSKSEKVPAINSIQFRMIGYPSAGWMDVPYKLKTDSTLGTVYAEVDDMLFAVIFKEVKYCPEFRAAREEGGKIVQIWEKGQPECATDYVP